MVNRYTPKEVLEIFQANYLQLHQLGSQVEKRNEINGETTIEEWIAIDDLLETDELAEYFNYYFEVEIPQEEWLLVLEPRESRTLEDLCRFISDHVVKPSIKSVRIFGLDCQSAATFKYLMNRFKQKGIAIGTIRPSSLLEPFAKENFVVLIEEVNKINPLALPPVNYKSNYLTGMGELFFLFGFVLLIASIWAAGLYSIIIAFIGLGVLLLWLGLKFKPVRTSFDGVNTFRELVEKIIQK